MTTKRCFKCLYKKPFEAFYKHAQMSDGLLGKCKDCTKNDVNKHRQENLMKIRSYDKMRGSMTHRVAARKVYAKTPEGKSAHARALTVSRMRFPKRSKARVAVGNAIRDGKLVRLPCLVCGNTSEAHHPDYDRPLEVVWLCQPHHKQAHALIKEPS